MATTVSYPIPELGHKCFSLTLHFIHFHLTAQRRKRFRKKTKHNKHTTMNIISSLQLTSSKRCYHNQDVSLQSRYTSTNKFYFVSQCLVTIAHNTPQSHYVGCHSRCFERWSPGCYTPLEVTWDSTRPILWSCDRLQCAVCNQTRIAKATVTRT